MRHSIAGAPDGAQKPFSDPLSEARLYHEPARWGYFSILYETAPRRTAATEARRQLSLFHQRGETPPQTVKGRAYNTKTQRSYELRDLPWVLTHLEDYGDFETTDYWLSQAEFAAANRRKINLLTVGLLWADVDYYNTPCLKGLHPDAVLHAVLRACAALGIPDPSIALFSGRGLQLKWLHEPLPGRAYPRWSACMRYLNEGLNRELDGAVDLKARDASRVLRIAGTRNSRSCARVEPVYVDWDYDEPRRHVFDDLADAVLPFSREQLAALREARGNAFAQARAAGQVELLEGGGVGRRLRSFSPLQLSWDRVHDFRKLARLRSVHERPEGWTNELIWLAASSLGIAVWGDVSRFDLEIQVLARELAPHWEPARVRDAVSSVHSRVRAMGRGEWVEWRGRQMPPVYTPRTETIIDLLDLREDELEQLRTIITPEIKRGRHADRERRRRETQGSVSRQQYEGTAARRRDQAQRLYHEGLSQRQVADALGISRGAVQAYLRVD